VGAGDEIANPSPSYIAEVLGRSPGAEFGPTVNRGRLPWGTVLG
jgi:hypothetical protein